MQSNYLSSITIKNPKKIQILIDTGAININIITKKFFEELKKVQELPYQTTSKIVMPIGSKPLKSYGSTLVSLELEKGMKTELIPFIIIDNVLRYDIILGLPAMEQLRIKLDLEKGFATILNKNFKLNLNNFTNHTEIRASKNHTLKPGNEQFIEVELDKKIFENDKDNFHIVIPSKTIKEIQTLETPNAVTKGNLTHILIGNRLDKPVDIKKGALLGHLIANNPIDNLCYISGENNSIDEEAEDEIEDKIYIPDISKQELIKPEDIISHLKLQTNHLQEVE